MTRITVLALLCLACLASTATAAPSQAACSDQSFLGQKETSSRQMSMALSYMRLESNTSAEAWALRSWRTLQASAPCQATYRRWRQYQINSATAIWNAVKAQRRGDDTASLKLIDKAIHWTDLAGAEEANWG